MWRLEKTHVTSLVKGDVEVSRQLLPDWLLPEIIESPEIPGEDKVRLVGELLNIIGAFAPGLPQYMVAEKITGKPQFERLSGSVLALGNRMPRVHFVIGDEYYCVPRFDEGAPLISNVRKAMRGSIYPFSILWNQRMGYYGWEETPYPIVYEWTTPVALETWKMDEWGGHAPAGVTYGWLFTDFEGPDRFLDVWGREYSTDPEAHPRVCRVVEEFKPNSAHHFKRNKVRETVEG